MQILVALSICMAIHLLTIAATAAVLGVTVRTLVLGLGPVIFRWRWIELRLVLIGGQVRLRDSSAEPVPPQEMRSALDGRSVVERIMIALSGCLMLLLVADLALGSALVPVLTATPGQIFGGALSPLGQAQTLIASAVQQAASLPFLALLGLVAVKFAFINLWPSLGTNGGYAIGVLARSGGVGAAWDVLSKVFFWLTLAVALSWLVAICVFVAAT